MRSWVVMGLASLTCGSGCGMNISGSGPAIVGSGVTKQEERKVPNFTELSVSSTFEAIVTTGPERSVILQVDDNLLPYVRTEVRDDRLIVGFVEGHSFRTSRPQKVVIVTPRLDVILAQGAAQITATVVPSPNFRLDSSGASKIRVQGVASDNVEASLSGASRITLEGSGKLLQLVMKGASRFEAGNAPFFSAQVKVEGASTAALSASEKIEGTVSGASSLAVKGGPKNRQVKVSEASRVSY